MKMKKWYWEMLKTVDIEDGRRRTKNNRQSAKEFVNGAKVSRETRRKERIQILSKEQETFGEF